MSVNQDIHMLGAQTAAALRKNHFEAVYFKACNEAISHILSLLPPKSSVGIGGSVTIQELELIPLLENSNHEILNHNDPHISAEEALEIRRRQLICDVFLTSANAITRDGKIVNTDGVGNRTAAMIFGPKTIIIIAGVNKIVEDEDAAYKRIQSIAAPLNNKRLNRPNPCVKTGKCINCQTPTRICNVTTVLHKKPSLSKTHVVIIGRELGY